jgi:hypothetical protein
MPKGLLILIFLMTLPLSSMAQWNPYVLKQERFGQLNDQNQNKVIVRTMEVVVEMEEKYLQQVQQYGYSAERYQQYVQVLKKLQNFLITQAHAAKNAPGFSEIANDFTSLIESKKDKACLYGGWVSEIKTINGVKVCRHPSHPDVDKKIRDAYHNVGGKCVAPAAISCNPLIFGYKKSQTEEPFCVSVKGGKTHNASYDCMAEALKVEGQIGDSKEVRLEHMRNSMSSPAFKEGFEKVHGFIFRTCVCSGDGVEKINSNYMSYARPHRTCFGLMNSLRAMEDKNCKALGSTLSESDHDFFEKWNEFFSDENTKKLTPPISKEPEQFDNEYAALINHKNVAQFCGGKIEVTPVPLPASEPEVCIPAEDGSTEQCQEEIEPKIEDEKKPENECSVTLTVSDDKLQVMASVQLIHPDQDDAITEMVWSGNEEAKAKKEAHYPYEEKLSVSFTAKVKESGQPLTCEATLPEELKEEKSKGKIGADLEVKEEEKQELTITLKAFPKFTLEDGSTSEKLPAGHSISWSRKGAEKLKLETKTKKEKKAKKSSRASDGDGPSDTTAEVEITAPKGQVATGSKITENRSITSYETCASILDAGSKVVAGPKCLTIPKLKTPGDGNIQTPPPPMPMRQQFHQSSGMAL